MANPVKPIPEHYHTVTPYLTVRDADRAIDFYKRAFGAEELHRMYMPDGRIMHAEIRIGNSVLMLSEEFLEMGGKSPQTLRGTPVGLIIYSNSVDETYRRVVEAGATSKMAPQDMFWGDRYCKVQDPFGHDWSIATHIEDVSPEEMERRSKEAFSKPK